MSNDDFFAFSDSIRDIDEEAPYIHMRWWQLQKELLAILCIDTSSGQESLYIGHIKTTDYTVLEIETLDGRNVSLNMINADFCPLKPENTPAQLKALGTGSFENAQYFNTGKLKGYLLPQIPPPQIAPR
jgi:hypothetical protein